MADFLKQINAFLWSGPLLVLLLGTHIILTVRCGFIQKKLGKGIRLSLSEGNGPKVLFTTLAATLGTGNIIGVSTAIALGGPGALFWCMLTGLFGMATTYYECYLGRLYKTEQGGGPMYVLRDALNAPRLGKLYALSMLLVCFGTGCLTQSNAVSVSFSQTFHIPGMACGWVIAILCGLVIAGGKDSISKVCTKIVPVMCILFLAGCIYILFRNYEYIIPGIKLIINDAFSFKAVSGGIAGGGFLACSRYGIARGLFTNEAGLGSAAVFAGGGSLTPKEQALVSMTATFWDTIVICSVTGLVIISSYLSDPASISGYGAGEYAIAAFGQVPYVGKPFLTFAIAGFAIATIVGWFYPGEQSVQFLFGKNEKKILPIVKTIYIVMVFLGGIFPLEPIWETADFFNIFLILPNVYALIKMSTHYSEN